MIEHSPDTPTPSDRYRQMLLRRQHLYYHYGRMMAIWGTGSLSIFAIFFIMLLVQTRGNLHDSSFWFASSILFVTHLLIIGGGLWLLKKARRELTARDIEQLRRRERVRLFRQAQGILSLEYRLIGRVLLIGVGSLLCIGGLVVIYFFGLLALDGWGYLILGIILLVGAIFILPKEGKRLQQESAKQLSRILIYEETQVDGE